MDIQIAGLPSSQLSKFASSNGELVNKSGELCPLFDSWKKQPPLEPNLNRQPQLLEEADGRILAEGSVLNSSVFSLNHLRRRVAFSSASHHRRGEVN